MRVCIHTCAYADNHGAVLQAYALSQFLQQHGHTVQIVNYDPPYHYFGCKRWYFPGVNIKEWGRLLFRYRVRDSLIRRHEQFRRFAAENLPMTHEIHRTCESLAANPPEADVYIVGSDQVWNTFLYAGKDPSYLLRFGKPDIARLSYAASFATDTINPDYADVYTEALNEFAGISVRESSGLGILESLGLHGTQVVDPVFLLGREFWQEDFGKSFVPDEPYLLVYDFESSDKMRRLARRAAKINGLKIYTVSPFSARYAHRNFTSCTPQEFVALVRHARCIISNSFHGSAFALLFERDFFVVNRDDGLNRRMADLLAHYGLSHRLIDDSIDDSALASEIDYAGVRQRLQQDTATSRAWLLSHLEP